MAEVRLKAALPKDEESNGLVGWASRLLEDPELERVAIVTFVTVKEEIDIAAGSHTPIIQLTRVEPVADEAEAAVLAGKLHDMAADRTGLVQLPLDDGDLLGFDGDAA